MSYAFALQGLQSANIHTEDISYSKALHEAQIQLQTDMHQRSMEQLAQQHSESHSLERELFLMVTTKELDIARREAARDAWQRRNEQTQTMMIVTTLMFGCAYTTLVDGKLPPNSSLLSQHLFSITVSASLLVTLGCCVLLLILHKRMTLWNVHSSFQRYACGLCHRTFRSYYQCHCKRIQNYAMSTFYVGALLTIVSCSVLVVTKLQVVYKNTAAAVLYSTAVGLAAIMVVVGRYIYPSKTSALQAGDEDEIHTDNPFL